MPRFEIGRGATIIRQVLSGRSQPGGQYDKDITPTQHHNQCAYDTMGSQPID